MELLLAMVILGVVVLAVGAAIVVLLRNNGAISDRLVLAHDQALMSAYFVPDVQSAGPGVASSISGSGCSSGGNLLTLTWSETLSTTNNYSSGYKVLLQSGQWQLTRTLSTNGVAQSPQIVAHALSSPTSAGITCSGSGKTVAMTITEKAGSASVSASRREP